MRRIKYIAIIIVGVSILTGGCQLLRISPKKIACVGDSITYGHGIRDREQSSYPAQLEEILGAGYDVENFGVSGSTMLKSGDLPYWEQEAYSQALAFNPDIVVIMLGTNDSKPWNWEHSEDFSHDYSSLINEFMSLKTKPEIWICNPVPAYSSRWGIRDSIIRNVIIPEIGMLASSENVKLIDFYEPFLEKEGLFPDSIHPDSTGAFLIAEQIANTLKIN